MVIGEPTGLRPVCAGKGYALAEIVVRGKEAHSAFPSHGRSAIYDAARVVTALERVAKKLETRKNRAFDPPFTTLNVGLIQGGTAKNIVAGECRITVEWRPIPGQPGDWAAELIREVLAGLPVDATLDVKRLDPGFRSIRHRESGLDDGVDQRAPCHHGFVRHRSGPSERAGVGGNRIRPR